MTCVIFVPIPLLFLSDPVEIIESSNSTVVVIEGDDLSLFCTVFGRPMPDVQWRDGSGQILTTVTNPSVEISVSLLFFPAGLQLMSSLTVSGISYSARGQYSCNAFIPDYPTDVKRNNFSVTVWSKCSVCVHVYCRHFVTV